MLKKSLRQLYPRLYECWHSMKKRCLNPKDTHYRRYGARGITVCDEWLKFVSFCEWALNNGYNDNLSIDRIDNNGNYEPSNCRWTNFKIQCDNRSTTHHVEYKGQIYNLSELSKKLKIPYPTLAGRYAKGYRGDELCSKEALSYVPKKYRRS